MGIKLTKFVMRDTSVFCLTIFELNPPQIPLYSVSCFHEAPIISAHYVFLIMIHIDPGATLNFLGLGIWCKWTINWLVVTRRRGTTPPCWLPGDRPPNGHSTPARAAAALMAKASCTFAPCRHSNWPRCTLSSQRGLLVSVTSVVASVGGGNCTKTRTALQKHLVH